MSALSNFNPSVYAGLLAKFLPKPIQSKRELEARNLFQPPPLRHLFENTAPGDGTVVSIEASDVVHADDSTEQMRDEPPRHFVRDLDFFS